METENLRAMLRPTTNAPGKLSAWVVDADTLTGGRVLAIVTRDELVALAQAAYDQYGILAEPSYVAEAARFDALQDEAEDERLRTFADAWGRSLGDTA